MEPDRQEFKRETFREIYTIVSQLISNRHFAAHGGSFESFVIYTHLLPWWLVKWSDPVLSSQLFGRLRPADCPKISESGH